MTLQYQRILLTLCIFLLCRSEAFHASSQTGTSHHRNLLPRTSTSVFYRDDVTSTSRHAFSDSTMVSTASPQTSVDQSPGDVELSGVSMPLIRSICYNQMSLLLFSTAAVAGVSMLTNWNFQGLDLSLFQWNGGPAHAIFDFIPQPAQMLQGALAVAPLIGLERFLQESDDRGAIQSSFATSNMVLSLFGRRKSVEDFEGTSPELMGSLALGIALCTALSEELIFRAYAPIALYALSHSVFFALIGQAVIFALVHISPSANAAQNRVMGGLQFTNGLWYGLLYLMTGGDVLPCIIAHVLHDMYIFSSSWNSINNQMDYTQKAYKMPLPESEESAMAKLQELAGPSLNRETLNFARRFFYAFDSKQQGSLSLQDVHRAVDYAFLKEENTPEVQVVEEMFDTLIQARATTELPNNRLGVSEFLCLLFALKSNTPILILEKI